MPSLPESPSFEGGDYVGQTASSRVVTGDSQGVVCVAPQRCAAEGPDYPAPHEDPINTVGLISTTAGLLLATENSVLTASGKRMPRLPLYYGMDIESYNKAIAASKYFGYAGWALGVGGKVIRLTKMLELDVAYGRFWWETRDVFSGVQIDKQSDADRLLEAKLSINFGPVGLSIGRKQMSNVAGSDLDVMMLGVQYTFK